MTGLAFGLLGVGALGRSGTVKTSVSGGVTLHGGVASGTFAETETDLVIIG